MIEWERILETLIGAGVGAGVVVIIDALLKCGLDKRKTFQDAISIQVALNQMLSISLQIRKFNDEKEMKTLEFYRSFSKDPSILWPKYRHIELSPYLNTFDVIKSDWDFKQFLTKKNNKIRDILKYLIPIKSGYDSLMKVCDLRNNIVQKVNTILEKIPVESIYNPNLNDVDVLDNIIGISNNESLKSITDEYLKKIDQVICDCNKSFDVLSKYISENFRNYEPLRLFIPEDLEVILNHVSIVN